MARSLCAPNKKHLNKYTKSVGSARRNYSKQRRAFSQKSLAIPFHSETIKLRSFVSAIRLSSRCHSSAALSCTFRKCLFKTHILRPVFQGAFKGAVVKWTR